MARLWCIFTSVSLVTFATLLFTTMYSLGKTKQSLLLVMIHASGKPSGQLKRATIRTTWGLDNLGGQVLYKFVLGVKGISSSTLSDLIKEQRSFQDMIFLDDVTDSHDSLTERTLRGFEYVVGHKYKSKYVLKCDDDTVVNIENITSELRNRIDHGQFYWGEIKGANQIELEGAYAERGWSICEKYLPYAYGGGYIVSMDLVKLIVQNAEYLKLYNNEDVSLGAWLAPYNLETMHDARFDTGSESRGCKPEYLMSHTITDPKIVRKYYRKMKKKGVFCDGKDQWFKYFGHIYNWNVPPSQCCQAKEPIP